MKRLHYLFLIAGVLSFTLPLSAQQIDNSSSEQYKKVVIVKEVIDENGNKSIEKTIAEGSQADQLLEEINNGEVDHDQVWIQQGSGDKIEIADEFVILKDENGDNNVEVEVTDENGHRIITVQKGDEEPITFEIREEGVSLDPDDNNLFSTQKEIELNANAEGEQPIMKNIEVNVESENGEKFIVMHQYQDGKEKVIKWRSKEGLPDDIDGELAKIRIRSYEGEHDIEHRMQNCAALGVYVGTHGEMLKVSGIIGESGAETAGLQEGDLIHTINGEEVRNFKELRQTLSAYVPGDVVKVGYERNGQKQVTDATLTAWKDLPSMQDSYLSEIECDDIYNDPAPKVEDEENGAQPDRDRTGINESLNTLQLADFSMYPNPTDGKVQVSFTADATPTLVKVLDVSGKEVLQTNLEDFAGEFNQEIDLSGNAKGSYILMIEQNNKVFSEQLVIQ